MKDELQTVSAAGVPATVVNQNGEKNVHIDRADTVNQNITFNFPYVARTSDGRMQPTSRTINQNYYNLFVMGMISGHETNPKVKEVFDYLYNDLNKTQVAKLNPDKIYNKQLPNEIKNYPVGFEEIYSDKIFDFQYKQSMLDKWEF